MAASEFSARSVGVAVACGIGAIISGISIVSNSIGVLIGPIADEFGYSRTQISGILLPAVAASALVTPLIGRAVDRWGARRIVLAGILLFSFSTMLVATTSGSLIQLYCFYALIGVTGSAAGAVAFNKVLSGWFQRWRGLVLALVGSGGAIGAAIVPEVTFAILPIYGWRGCFVGLGALVLAIGLPVFFLLFRDPPEVDELVQHHLALTSPDPIEIPGCTTRQALRTSSLWLIIGAIAVNAMVGFGLQVHVVSLLTERGINAAKAVSVLATFGIGGIAGQLSAGYLLDRFQTPRIALPFFTAALIGVLLMSFGHGLKLLIPAGLLLRIGVGAELSMAPYLIARYFGLRSFGEIYGLMYLLAMIGGAVGPLLMGFCHDQTGSYDVALVVFELALAASVGMIALLGPYVFAVQPPAEGSKPGKTSHHAEFAHR